MTPDPQQRPLATVAGGAGLAVLATYVAFFGTDPLASRPLFPYLAVACFLLPLVVAVRLVRDSAPDGPARRALRPAATGTVLGVANVVVALVVGDGSTAAAVVGVLGALAVLWGVGQLGGLPALLGNLSVIRRRRTPGRSGSPGGA